MQQYVEKYFSEIYDIMHGIMKKYKGAEDMVEIKEEIFNTPFYIVAYMPAGESNLAVEENSLGFVVDGREA